MAAHEVSVRERGPAVERPRHLVPRLERRGLVGEADIEPGITRPGLRLRQSDTLQLRGNERLIALQLEGVLFGGYLTEAIGLTACIGWPLLERGDSGGELIVGRAADQYRHGACRRCKANSACKARCFHDALLWCRTAACI